MRILKKIAIGLLVLAVVLAGTGWWILRGDPAEHSLEEVTGTDPVIAEPDAQTIPTVDVAAPVGWAEGQAPEAAQGLAVNRFAEGLEHPRVIYPMPNGDILVAESNAPSRVVAGGNAVTNWIAGLLFSRAGASVPSRQAIPEGESRPVRSVCRSSATPSPFASRSNTSLLGDGTEAPARANSRPAIQLVTALPPVTTRDGALLSATRMSPLGIG